MTSSKAKNENNSLLIELENTSGYYVAGSIVNGKLILSLSKPTKARNIILSAFGFAKTSFIDENDKDVQEVSAGKYCYNFSFEIPQNVLPSFAAENGQIKYGIKAEMEMHLGLNLKTEKKIYVLTIMHPSIVNNSVKSKFFYKEGKEKFITFEINAGQHQSYNRIFKITKYFPTISDEIIDVKHFVYIKLLKKSMLTSTITEKMSISLYTAKLEPLSGQNESISESSSKGTNNDVLPSTLTSNSNLRPQKALDLSVSDEKMTDPRIVKEHNFIIKL
uniref:Arrestin-like N-terminal domain-containing protein n=1 Tax=Panagrolaimus sp. ES5 TaxID=591445 RepID=A0AC34FNF4_9BILA